MNAEDLYNDIKEALDFFGLRFSEMNKMKVLLENNAVHFIYQNKSIMTSVGDEE